jgi:endonuclease YncB( thermonuclease family)
MSTPIVNFDFYRTLRSAQPRLLSRTSDGDTPVIEQPIRMVSCDTPEKAGYAGKPETSQPKLDQCRERLENGYYAVLPPPLRRYLIRKLTPDAARKHIEAGQRATEVFDQLLETRLTRPDGTKRKVAVIPTGQLIDTYGRLLAYLAPWFAGTRSDPLPPRGDPARRTFNLDMIENGWAAFFPIYPSLPGNDDFNQAIAAAETVWRQRLGAWREYGRRLLLAYEFRMCIKLGTAKTAAAGIEKAFERLCVDLRTMRVVGKFGFYRVPPPYRLWVWEADIEQATRDLGLG